MPSNFSSSLQTLSGWQKPTAFQPLQKNKDRGQILYKYFGDPKPSCVGGLETIKLFFLKCKGCGSPASI